MSIERPTEGVAATRPGRRWVSRSLLAAAVALALCLGGAIALSKPFQNGSTRLFGKVVDAVKDHPRWTVVLCLGGVAALWLSIGAMAAGQEWRGQRMSGRPRDANHKAAEPSTR